MRWLVLLKVVVFSVRIVLMHLNSFKWIHWLLQNVVLVIIASSQIQSPLILQ